MSSNKDKGAKKGAASSSASASNTQATASKDAPRPPIAKGHKQRGAGTVITAKAPVVTADGIVLKTHEKLPSQLLNEYCQSKQRPKPKYFTQAPAHRFSVILEDPKNSKNDLSFCPVQSFESDHVARDYAALLALWHFQKVMPLENKLPEPYSSTWRQMLREEQSDKKPSSATANTSQTKVASTKDASTTGPIAASAAVGVNISASIAPPTSKATADYSLSKPTAKSTPAVVKVDESSDWLCDSCGAQNFATLANGMVRNRCFKCQAAKSANPTRVASTAGLTAATASSNGKTEGAVPIKAAPAPVLDLKRDTSTRFVSAGEQRREQSEAQQESRRKRAYFDALRRANKPDFVFLCSRLKRKLEEFLGSSEGPDGAGANASGVIKKSDVHITYVPLPDLLQRLESCMPDSSQDGTATVPVSLLPFSTSSLSVADQIKVLGSSVVPALRAQEFGDDSISNALQFVFSVRSVRDKLLSEIRDLNDSAATNSLRQFADLVQESCLEYLCLYLNEEDLPQSMDGRNYESKPQLQLYKNPDSSNNKLSKAKSTESLSEDTTESISLTSGLQRGLVVFGCDSGAIEAVSDLLSQISPSIASSSSTFQGMVAGLTLLSTFWHVYKLPAQPSDYPQNYALYLESVTNPALSSPDSTSEAIAEEVSMLQAIFGEEAFTHVIHDELIYEYRLCVDLNSISPALFDIISFVFSSKSSTLSSSNNLVLQCFIQTAISYPSQPPAALLSLAKDLDVSAGVLSYNMDSDSMIPPSSRRAVLNLLQLEIQSKLREIVNEPMMFTLVGFVKDDLGDLFKRKYCGSASINSLPPSTFDDVSTFSSVLGSTANTAKSGGITDVSSVLTMFWEVAFSADSSENEGASAVDDDEEEQDMTTVASQSEATSAAGNTRSTKKVVPKIQRRSFWDTPLQRPANANASNIDTPERRKMAETRRSLPAFKSRVQFLKTMTLGRCCIVTGETGCGKSTQTPQYLMEEFPTAKIVVCQPRRLAAIGVATRVADECGCKLGQQVGYMVKGDSKATDTTQLVFCTYGVLLRRLQDDELLANISFVVLDEVHERGIDSDFALALLVSAMSARPTLKLILMSATISTDKFAAYIDKSLPVLSIPSAGKKPGNGKPAFRPTNAFSLESLQGVLPGSLPPGQSHSNISEDTSTDAMIIPDIESDTRAPVLFIPGYTFPVTEFFKNDYEQVVSKYIDSLLHADNTGDRIDGDDDDFGGGKGYYQRLARQQQSRKGELNYLLMAQLAVYLAVGGPIDPNAAGMLLPATGCILVFLPGVQEISRLMQLISTMYKDVTSALQARAPKLKLLPLHGGLTPQEQKQVFELASAGELKIVVSTNVAEASVTLSDVTVVIDSCRVKEVALDPERGVPALVTQLCSQDSLRQRRGRAGRVQEGRCFRLVTANTFQKLPAHSVPEILRVPLEDVVLQIKAMPKYASEEASRQLLSRCIDPPTMQAVMQAERYLMRLQALNKQKELSPLGRHLSELPCSPNIGRMLIYGAMLGCLSPAVTIAACMNVRSPFLSGSDDELRRRVDQAKKRLETAAGWGAERGSKRLRGDYLVVVQAVKEFTQCGGMSKQRQYAYGNGLSFERMQEIVNERQELLQNLVQTSFITSVRQGLDPNSFENRNSGSLNIVASVCVAGLYPHIARVMRPPQRFVETVGGNIERDAEATEFKLYIPALECGSAQDEGKKSVDVVPSVSRATGEQDDITTEGYERVFIHPSSVNFANSSFKHTSYLLYGELQLTASNQKSMDSAKVWLRETLEPTVYSLLLFGGQLDVSYKDQRIYLDDWIRFSAPGRIAALVDALRTSLDNVLAAKVSNPAYDLTESAALRLATELLESDGLH